MADDGSRSLFRNAAGQYPLEILQRGFGDLEEMIAFIAAQRQRIQALVAEMDECQKAFTTRLVDVQQRSDDAQTAAIAALEKNLDTAAAWVHADLDKRLPTVRDAKTKRRAELQQQLEQLRQQQAEIEKQSADERHALQQENPATNQREEELKGEAQQQQAQIEQIDTQLAQARAGLGWLFGFGKIHQLREVRHRWETALYGTQSRLLEVRNQWRKLHDETEDAESRLQKAWRLRTAELARATEESQKLEDDFDGVCRREALAGLLADLQQPQPTGVEQADAAITHLLDFRVQIADATQGIGDSAELMGLMNGIESGLAKLQTSVEAVKKEQDMHSELSNLKLNTPPVVLQFHAIWDELAPIVHDEAAATQHPREFHARLRDEIGGHLTDKQIEAMFVALGDELNRATKEQWG